MQMEKSRYFVSTSALQNAIKIIIILRRCCAAMIAFYENLYDPNGKLLRIIVIVKGRQRPILNYYFYMIGERRWACSSLRK